MTETFIKTFSIELGDVSFVKGLDDLFVGFNDGYVRVYSKESIFKDFRLSEENSNGLLSYSGDTNNNFSFTESSDKITQIEIPNFSFAQSINEQFCLDQKKNSNGNIQISLNENAESAIKSSNSLNENTSQDSNENILQEQDFFEDENIAAKFSEESFKLLETTGITNTRYKEEEFMDDFKKVLEFEDETDTDRFFGKQADARSKDILDCSFNILNEDISENKILPKDFSSLNNFACNLSNTDCLNSNFCKNNGFIGSEKSNNNCNDNNLEITQKTKKSDFSLQNCVKLQISEHSEESNNNLTLSDHNITNQKDKIEIPFQKNYNKSHAEKEIFQENMNADEIVQSLTLILEKDLCIETEIEEKKDSIRTNVTEKLCSICNFDLETSDVYFRRREGDFGESEYVKNNVENHKTETNHFYDIFQNMLKLVKELLNGESHSSLIFIQTIYDDFPENPQNLRLMVSIILKLIENMYQENNGTFIEFENCFDNEPNIPLWLRSPKKFKKEGLCVDSIEYLELIFIKDRFCLKKHVVTPKSKIQIKNISIKNQQKNEITDNKYENDRNSMENLKSKKVIEISPKTLKSSTIKTSSINTNKISDHIVENQKLQKVMEIDPKTQQRSTIKTSPINTNEYQNIITELKETDKNTTKEPKNMNFISMDFKTTSQKHNKLKNISISSYNKKIEVKKKEPMSFSSKAQTEKLIFQRIDSFIRKKYPNISKELTIVSENKTGESKTENIEEKIPSKKPEIYELFFKKFIAKNIDLKEACAFIKTISDSSFKSIFALNYLKIIFLLQKSSVYVCLPCFNKLRETFKQLISYIKNDIKNLCLETAKDEISHNFYEKNATAPISTSHSEDMSSTISLTTYVPSGEYKNQDYKDLNINKKDQTKDLNHEEAHSSDNDDDDFIFEPLDKSFFSPEVNEYARQNEQEVLYNKEMEKKLNKKYNDELSDSMSLDIFHNSDPRVISDLVPKLEFKAHSIKFDSLESVDITARVCAISKIDNGTDKTTIIIGNDIDIKVYDVSQAKYYKLPKYLEDLKKIDSRDLQNYCERILYENQTPHADFKKSQSNFIREYRNIENNISKKQLQNENGSFFIKNYNPHIDSSKNLPTNINGFENNPSSIEKNVSGWNAIDNSASNINCSENNHLSFFTTSDENESGRILNNQKMAQKDLMELDDNDFYEKLKSSSITSLFGDKSSLFHEYTIKKGSSSDNKHLIANLKSFNDNQKSDLQDSSNNTITLPKVYFDKRTNTLIRHDFNETDNLGINRIDGNTYYYYREKIHYKNAHSYTLNKIEPLPFTHYFISNDYLNINMYDITQDKKIVLRTSKSKYSRPKLITSIKVKDTYHYYVGNSSGEIILSDLRGKPKNDYKWGFGNGLQLNAVYNIDFKDNIFVARGLSQLKIYDMRTNEMLKNIHFYEFTQNDIDDLENDFLKIYENHVFTIVKREIWVYNLTNFEKIGAIGDSYVGFEIWEGFLIAFDDNELSFYKL